MLRGAEVCTAIDTNTNPARHRVPLMPKFRMILRVTLAAWFVCGPFLSSQAQAQTVPGKEIAKKLFDEGAQLERKGEYADALVKYKEAEQIVVTPGLRFHQGYCHEMMGLLKSAVDEYELADQLARESNRSDVQSAVAARLERLRARVPQLAIRVVPSTPNAEVQLDGVAVAVALLDGKAFRLDPGEHMVSARAAGYSDFAKRVQVPEGVTTTVDIALVRNVPAAPATTVHSRPGDEHASGRNFALPIVTTIGAAGLIATGIALVNAAGSAQEDAAAKCAKQMTCDERSTVRTLDALALGSFVGGAGLGVLSAWLWTSKDKRTAVVAKPTPVGASLSLQGVF